MKDFLISIFGKKRADELELVVESNAPATTSVIGSGYENEYPMLPKEVVYMAVEGGFMFYGSLGPENLFNIKLFEALAKEWGKHQHPIEDTPEQIEAKTRELAHSAYDFYLDYFTLPKETAQEKAVEFWQDLLKP